MTPEVRRLAEAYRAEPGDLTARHVADAVLAELDNRHPEHQHLWKCGCLVNDGGAHRVGCPDHPEGVRGTRLS